MKDDEKKIMLGLLKAQEGIVKSLGDHQKSIQDLIDVMKIFSERLTDLDNRLSDHEKRALH